jgi:hypothetical protein
LTIANSTVRPLEEMKVDDIQSFNREASDFVAAKAPRSVSDSRRSARRLGRNVELRWNPQVFASAGYLVVMPNPRRVHRVWTKIHRRHQR